MITLEGKLTDCNPFIKAANNRFARNKIKQEETDSVAWLAKSYRPDVNFPAIIKIDWYCRNQKIDPDNIVFAKKFILDGLVRGGTLPDDGWKHVRGFQEELFVDKGNPRIEITVV